MTYYGAKDMATAFRTVRQNTIQTAQDIPEDQFGFSAAKGCLTVAATLTHLAAGTNMSQMLHGVDKRTHVAMEDFGAYMGQAKEIEAALTSKAAIIEALTTRGEQYAAWLETLTDEDLAEHVHFPAGFTPQSKTRFEMLLGAKEHEMHHCGQLMVLQRLLGITPHLTRRRQEAMAARAAAAPGAPTAHAASAPSPASAASTASVASGASAASTAPTPSAPTDAAGGAGAAR